MILEGIYAENVLMFSQSRPYPIMPQETSGAHIGSEAIYRYSLRDTDYPILALVDNISDSQGNTIPAGHYELALSDEKDFLILMQTKIPIAIIHTFKVEEDKEAFDMENSRKYKKLKKKQAKERENINKKRAQAGMPPEEEKINMEASIEYVEEGDYYLIKYERGTIRAWAAIKG